MRSAEASLINSLNADSVEKRSQNNIAERRTEEGDHDGGCQKGIFRYEQTRVKAKNTSYLDTTLRGLPQSLFWY